MSIIAHIAAIQTTTILAVAFIVGLGALGTAIGFALLGAKLLDTTARQPEMAASLQMKMFIVAGLLDAVTMIGIGLCLWFSTANPFVSALIAAAANS